MLLFLRRVRVAEKTLAYPSENRGDRRNSASLARESDWRETDWGHLWGISSWLFSAGPISSPIQEVRRGELPGDHRPNVLRIPLDLTGGPSFRTVVLTLPRLCEDFPFEGAGS
jgi:hypothetical protein